MAVLAGGFRLAAVVLVALCAGCGGGGSSPAPSATCDVPAQNAWLRGYMSDWYLWAGSAPSPDPAGYASVQSYFDALRYPGDGVVPKDHWSYIQDSASYNQFFGAGKTMGYGVSVNGIELTLPLKVRYVEPMSPAASAGLVRGDVIVSINGRTAADLVAANDFASLTAAKEGDQLTLEIQRAGTVSTTVLTAATFDLTPVTATRVLTLSNGAKAGYLSLKDFVPVAETPLAGAFAAFSAAGATEIIIDLRYNGGGRISTSGVLASLVAGGSNGGKVFAQLNYNSKHSASNSAFFLSSVPSANFTRAIVITGPRTCSASELLVNGLKPYMDVVTLGGTTCGKPFGFTPVESCGSTFSAVNFESFNALGNGRYYAGIVPSCPMADDFSGELGDAGEKLTAGAVSYLQTGMCPPEPLSAQSMSLRKRTMLGTEPGERRGMSTN